MKQLLLAGAGCVAAYVLCKHLSEKKTEAGGPEDQKIILTSEKSEVSDDALKEEEYRIDPADGRTLSLAGFIGHYGGSIVKPPQQWLDAPVYDSAAAEDQMLILKSGEEDLTDAGFDNHGRAGLYCFEDVIAPLAPNVKNVELNFQDCDMLTDVSLNALAARMPQEATQLLLNFRRSKKFTEAGFITLFKTLPPRATKVHLWFHESKLSEAALKALAAAMPQSAVDISLIFTNSKLSEAALISLAEAIPRNATKITFFFRDSACSEAGSKKLLAALPATANKRVQAGECEHGL